nr:hypothetical protein [Tanacetum cinerariifolium]
ASLLCRYAARSVSAGARQQRLRLGVPAQGGAAAPDCDSRQRDVHFLHLGTQRDAQRRGLLRWQGGASQPGPHPAPGTSGYRRAFRGGVHRLHPERPRQARA